MLVAVLALGACKENPAGAAAYVLNRTGQPIDVYHVVDSSEELLISLERPVSASFYQEIFSPNWSPDGCTSGELVARTSEGDEVARLTEELCLGQTWRIESDGTSSVQGERIEVGS
jgi:hypothetical protein